MCVWLTVHPLRHAIKLICSVALSRSVWEQVGPLLTADIVTRVAFHLWREITEDVLVAPFMLIPNALQ